MNIINRESVGSTNEYARQIVESSELEEWTVVVADYQESGRGRNENRWFSSKGKNILCSIILKPEFLSAESQFYLSMVVSLGLISFLHEYIKNPKIKWPNDIYIGNKKIAGILIENSVIGKHLEYSVTGIGLNVNENNFPDYLPNPVSLKQLSGCSYDLNLLTNQLISHIRMWYEKLKSSQWTLMKQAYLENMYKINQENDFIADGQQFTATIKGITEQGLIILEKEGQKHYEFELNQIEYVL